MQVIKSSKDIYSYSSGLKKDGKTVGLVPTMGALHSGHFSLVREAVSQNDVTIVSIFVNPLQFNNPQDLQNYPKTVEQDLVSLKELGVELVFLPDASEFYPILPLVSISFGDMANVMEGEFRPGHFEGVGVVVSKLFHLINPDNAYFGLKDLQQFLLIKRMVQDLSMPLEVHGLPTVRHESGLAMSSRNQRLSAAGKHLASNIFQGLKLAEKELIEKKSIGETKKLIFDFYNSFEGLSIEYLNIVDTSSLKEVKVIGGEVAVCVAGYVEGVRLIDNLYLQID